MTKVQYEDVLLVYIAKIATMCNVLVKQLRNFPPAKKAMFTVIKAKTFQILL